MLELSLGGVPLPEGHERRAQVAERIRQEIHVTDAAEISGGAACGSGPCFLAVEHDP